MFMDKMSRAHGIAVVNFSRLKLLQDECTRLLRESCFKPIWERLNYSGDASDKSISRFFNEDPAGKKIRSRLMSMQKKFIDEGDVDNFDISILNAVLKSEPFINHMSQDHLEALKNIVAARNTIAHQELPNEEEYENLSSQFATALLSLGGTDEKISEIRACCFNKSSQKTSTDATKMREVANAAFKQGDMKRAIELYTEAIVVADEDDNELCILYCNRAMAYLKLNEGDEERNLHRALKDANASSKCNPGWFKPYVRLGQISERQQDLEEARQLYEKALALEPTSLEIKNMLADVKRLIGERSRREHMLPLYQPMSSEERSKHYHDHTGLGKSGAYNNFPKAAIKDFLEKRDPALIDLYKAHEYRDGSEKVKQNYEMAARHYSKAAAAGNAESMYNLALLTRRGLGVEKDYREAHELLMKAASMPQMISLEGFQVPNVGVAEAEHSLGLSYQEGVYVAQNYAEAVKWYERAVKHGSATAANNLGLMYEAGKGMNEPDLEMAEDLYLLAHRLSDCNGALNLAIFNARRLDTDRALMWFDRALKQDLSRLRAQSMEESFKKQVEEARISNKYYTPNTTMDKKTGNLLSHYAKQLDKAILRMRMEPTPRVTSQKGYDMAMLTESALKGNKTAERLLKSLKLMTGSAPIDKCQLLHSVAENFDIDAIPSFTSIQTSKALAVIEDVLEEKANNQLDRDARVAYALLNTSEDVQPMIEFLRVSLKRYPKDTAMLALLGSLYIYMPDYSEALALFDSALKLKPDNLLAMHGKAAALRLLGRGDEAYKQYKQFLSHAPADHPAVPESHYAMACCLRIGHREIDEAVMDTVEPHFKNGLESEGRLLPCFLPYKSRCKDYCSLLLLYVKGPMAAEQKSESRCSRLTSPLRVEVVDMFRKSFAEKHKYSSAGKVLTTYMPDKRQRASALSECEEIELRDIDFGVDHVLDKRVLRVTQIDIPFLRVTTLCLLVEDVNKHVERVNIYGLKVDEESIKKTYKIGTRLAIVNPYVRMAADGKPMIRIDDPDSVIIEVGNEVKAMCRFCGRPESKLQCGKCSSAKYCSKECQVDDWKLQHHKLICNTGNTQ